MSLFRQPGPVPRARVRCRHGVLILLLPLALFLAALPATGAEGPDPQARIRQTTERLLETFRAEEAQIRAHPERLCALVSDIVLPVFDFERMARWVLGRYWRRADEGQRRRFIGEFRTMLVRTYSSALLEYTGQEVTYLPLRMQPGDDEVTVRTEIEQPGAFPIPVHYRLHHGAGGWQVFDVTIDGVSLVANYRTTFGNEIREHGLEQLIQRLAARNRQEEGL